MKTARTTRPSARLLMLTLSALILSIGSTPAFADDSPPEPTWALIGQLGFPIVKLTAYHDLGANYYAGASFYTFFISTGGAVEIGKRFNEDNAITRYALSYDESERSVSSELGGPSRAYNVLANFNRQNFWQGSRHFGWTYSLSAGLGYRSHAYNPTRDKWSPVAEASIGIFVQVP